MSLNLGETAGPAEFAANDGSLRIVPLSQSDYERFREFILDKTGLDYPEDKRHMLDRGLAQVMRATRMRTLDELYTLLKHSSPTSSACDELVSALTIGETYFFRNAPHFDVLTKEIVPALVAEREYTSRQIRIWSAGCATGEEPYSIAIHLLEMIPNIESWTVLILATDINREALRRARAAKYSAWSFRGADKRLVEKYFRTNGTQFELVDRVKRMVTFDHLNLVTDPYPSLTNNTNAMDIVLCRNVTIYFSAPVTQQVLHGFHNSLVPGGWFIPGPSEPNMLFYGEFDPQSFPGTVIYQKPANPKRAPEFVTPAREMPFASTRTAPPSRHSFLSNRNAPSRPASRPAFKASALRAKTPPPAAPTNVPEGDLYVQALALMDAGRNPEALSKLYEKLNQDAKFVPTYIALGKVYANQGNLEEAQHWCERALELDRLNPQPYYLLSMIYQENGMAESAIEALKKTVYLDRDFILAHYSLGQLYLARGDKDAARKSLQNVQRLLTGKDRDSLVPEGDGMIVGRLQEMVEGHLAHDL